MIQYQSTPDDSQLPPVNAEQAMANYVSAYQRLYQRVPRDLHALDHEWVIVNGARMRAVELEHLTRQLLIEINHSVMQRKSIVSKLIGWFKSS